jgi:hypothetical protein
LSTAADRTHTEAGTTWTEGAAVHPRFLRVGPWVLSLVVATLFVLSFATSYAALHDYALQLQFGREFAIVFPLVLDAVISVLAVTVLLERALRRRTIMIKGWRFALRWPTWPLCALWIYFGGSVAGTIAHVPQVLAAQLVAAVPPISAALTFHLLLRLLDRAPALSAIAEAHEERGVEERERAARRQARRAQLKTQRMDLSPHVVTGAVNSTATRSSNGDDGRYARAARNGHSRTGGHRAAAAAPADRGTRQRNNDPITVQPEDLIRRVQTALAAGDRVTGETVGQWLGVSARTGRRRLAALLERDPALAHAIEHTHAEGRVQPPSAMRR